MLIVIVAFVFFRAETLTDACIFIGHMFNPFTISVGETAMFAQQLTPMYVTMLCCAVIFSMPVWQTIRGRIKSKELIVYGEAGSYLISLLMLFMCIVTLSSASYNPFIYFRF